MKRWFALLFLLILLTGCEKHNAGVTDLTQGAPEPTEPPTEFAQYQSGHEVEVRTQGAVTCYTLSVQDCYAMLPMGNGALLLSGSGNTTFTYVTEGQLPVHAAAGCAVSADHPSLLVSEKGVTYYDRQNHVLVFLDEQLQESARSLLPDEVQGDPVVSKDRQCIYYYTEDALRCLDLRTGISRLLQESAFSNQQVMALRFEDQLLECLVTVDGEEMTRYVSTETGETLFEAQGRMQLYTQQQDYFTQWFEADQTMFLYGSRKKQPGQIRISETGTIYPMLSQNCIAVISADDSGMVVTRYDLTEGNRISQVKLNNVQNIWDLMTETSTGHVWILAKGSTSEADELYCWDPSLSQQAVTECYISPYYTVDSPDVEGLEQCKALAETIGENHGVEIKLWDEADDALPSGHWVTMEHRVDVYKRSLEILDQALGQFPDEIFTKLGKKSRNHKLTISLVNCVYGTSELGSETLEDGIQFWKDGSSYLVLPADEQLETKLYHELFHAMDSYVLTETKYYDSWESLNPSGFSYDYSYIANENRNPKNYLEPETRAFIDIYSMSYPKEDRARIMEYAMLEGNDQWFTSKTMGRKLETLCKGIRKAFDLSDTQTYLWEQYLPDN